MTKAQWEKFRNLTDDEIDTSDIPELDETFWKNAKVVYPQSKQAISIRIDEDVLYWLKKQGKGYQSRINAILRSYMQSHK